MIPIFIADALVAAWPKATPGDVPNARVNAAIANRPRKICGVRLKKGCSLMMLIATPSPSDSIDIKIESL
jgi:hypothetical protein